MTYQPRILVVDDDRYDNDRYCEILRSAGYEVHGILDVEQAQLALSQQGFDVVILDMLLPLRLQGRLDFGGIEVLHHIKQHYPITQVIAVTGYGSRELAVEAMAAGAFDYITKDLDTEDRLSSVVQEAVRWAQYSLARSQSNDNQANKISLTTPNYLVADCEAMRKVLRRTQRLAGTDLPLLIVGEPGVGKQLLATMIHINSHYSSGQFKVVPCRNLSESLVELWGDMLRSEPGICAQVEGGTLVLKGVQDLSFDQQKQLVRMIDRKVYQPLNAKEEVRCNLRVIATTTVDLERLVRQGRFWRALFDALRGATIDVPPLRERRDKDDIMAIAGSLLHRYKLASGIAPETAALLAAYDYQQGNITELEYILRYAAKQANGGLIQPDHLPSLLRDNMVNDLVVGNPSTSKEAEHPSTSERAPLQTDHATSASEKNALQHERLTRIRQILMAYFKESELRDISVDLGITYEKLTGQEKKEPPEQVSPKKLRDILTNYFNDSELHDLCFEMGIDYESIPGQGKKEKAREVIQYCRRYDRIYELIELCYKLRPNAPW